MPRPLRILIRRRLSWLLLLLTVWLLCSGEAVALPLSDRFQDFPAWEKLPLPGAKGDLAYPDWMAGTWELTSTLVDLAAPLAPDIVTPGFESNQSMLDQPITCVVRFVEAPTLLSGFFPRVLSQGDIVADRAFNGLNMAQAYLGEAAVKAVKVDPNNPNRQLTLLDQGRQLESTVTARTTEAPQADRFITAERFQQVFRGTAVPYLNEVETTTDYWNLGDHIEADQVTAVYLSPQDPDFLAALGQPVALYRYHLHLSPLIADGANP
ncbi:hypothetical protein GFS31_39020 [Leptolyngbya sp. BL0902]|uniref:DUF6816 family protein n=1 Tax=Leptolyngbya sp. BL0902 TaxID=1115757 RepID=UPI0018E8FC0C|nr:hypothetical protein [Leptolyngbya sp. BL0902]QQE67190.1 hypothetical protein GFS31_39020 [Leptolyngbya sp. BL0902]